MVLIFKNPALALDPKTAADILFRGMRDGWFTGKKLDDYIHGGTINYQAARQIVNGSDRATLIAGYAEAFQTALEDAITDDESRPVETTGKAMQKSTTNISATVGGITGILGTVSGHLTTAKTALAQFLDGAGLPDWTPVALVLVIGFGAYAWIIRERRKKSFYYGI